MKPIMTRHQEKGQSLVELALVLVFILILLAGVVDLGRMMYQYLTMRDAAQEGAGYAAVFPSYCADITNRVRNNLPDNSYGVIVLVDGISCESAWAVDKTLTLPTHGCEGKDILVTLTHNFDVTMPLISVFTGPIVNMHVEINDRIVRPSCGN
jgi:hypothetical protein